MIRPEKAADLFSAKPDQGMNRSADQVRATCRVYVDAGRLPDEGLESIIRLFNLGRSRGYSFDQTGALVDYSGATISRLFAGKYEGALDKVVQQIDAYLGTTTKGLIPRAATTSGKAASPAPTSS